MNLTFGSRARRGNTLVGMLVVVAIIAILAIVVLGGGKGGSLVGESSRKDGKGRTTLGAAKAAAQDDVCRQQLGQVRAAITIAQTTDDTNPASIEELPGMKGYAVCPIGKEHYDYDPVSGTVHCPHPGHEKY